MPCVGFEPTIPVLERAKAVHALDRAATVAGQLRTVATDNNTVVAQRLLSFCSGSPKQQWRYVRKSSVDLSSFQPAHSVVQGSFKN
jgi:hypothetical protein